MVEIIKGNPFESFYQRIKELGHGGFGEVTLCQHKITGVKVAIKESGTSMVPEMTVGILCSKHKNILTPNELWFDGTKYFLVMPVIFPASKFEYSTLSLHQKSIFCFQLASAVHHMHQLGFMHCDIWQQNIGFYLSEDGDRILKLFDFGLSKRVLEGDDQKSLGGFQLDGKLSCMSPETIKSNTMSTSNDLWAMCLIIQEIFIETNKPLMELGLKDSSNVLALSLKIGSLKESPISDSFRQDQTPFGRCLLEILETGLAIEPKARDLEKIIRLLEQLVDLSAES